MPGVRSMLQALRRAETRVGLVSNAQFYTRLLFQAFLGTSPEGLGIASDLIAFSFETGRAKPDPTLFDAPLAALASAGIDSAEVVYLGNDMLNDVYTASLRGCMTALFAGDRRSLRLRSTDARVSGLMPDTLVRTLPEFLSVLEIEDL
jgi:putative hydrolase of the HAD superfamily